MAKLQVFVAFGQRRGEDPLHWILVTAPQDHSSATWYHVVGGPTRDSGYTLKIQCPKRFDSHGISQYHYVGELDERDQKKLKASAQKIPMQRCQRWTVAVLGDLERKGLVPAGTAEYWHHQVEPSRYEAGATGSGSGAGSRSSSRQSGSSRGSGSHGRSHPSSQGSSKWVWDESYQQYRHH